MLAGHVGVGPAVGRHVADDPTGSNFGTLPVKENNRGWAEYSEMPHQGLIKLIVSGHVSLQQHGRG